jgi:hypothetical protein
MLVRHWLESDEQIINTTTKVVNKARLFAVMVKQPPHPAPRITKTALAFRGGGSAFLVFCFFVFSSR